MERTRGAVDEALLGRLQNSAVGPQLGLDRGALADEERGPRRRRAAGGVRASDDAADDRRGARGARARPAVHRRAGRALPARVRLARGLEPRVHLPDGRASRWSRSSSSSAATSTTRLRLPDARSRRCAATSRPRRAEILEGLDGDALEEMRAANAVNLRMAPLTPDHHFYIDQGANAHVRLVLIAIGRKLVEAGRARPARRRHVPALQRAADADRRRRRRSTRAGSSPTRRAEREAAQTRPPARLGRHRDAVAARVPVPRQLGLPGALPPAQSATTGRGSRASAASPGVVEGIARVVADASTSSTRSRDGDILVCQMTNPAWVVLFTKIAGLVTDTGGTTSHPAVLVARVRDPGGHRHVRRDAADRDRRPDPGRRVGRASVEILRAGRRRATATTAARLAPIGS